MSDMGTEEIRDNINKALLSFADAISPITQVGSTENSIDYPEFVDVGFFAKLKYLLRAYGDELIKGGTFLNSFGSIFTVMSIVYAIIGSVKYFFTARSSSEE